MKRGILGLFFFIHLVLVGLMDSQENMYSTTLRSFSLLLVSIFGYVLCTDGRK